MKFKTESILPSPSDERLEAFEKYCRVTLPKEYREFLKSYNGAVPETNVFNLSEREYVVEQFLCLLEEPESDQVNGWYDIEVVLAQIDTRLTDDENLVGANVIPIASLFGGDFVCLDLRNEVDPSVVVWFHEESEDFQPVMVKVAKNFTEFLTMLS